MRKEYKIWFAGAGVLILIDLFAALGAPRLHFGEEALVWLSFLLIFATAFEGARLRNYKVAVSFAVLLSLLDGTVGVGIETLLGPGSPEKFTVAGWVYSVVFNAGLAAILGLGAGGLEIMTRPRKEE